ncbi:uncharacterized protein PGTG_10338 [Puccinia graminis f. sp. tritici CRL 75-36-700-3]|uniref:Catalase core domain-containing protein n=1 Tax=Puccinia graminis f. sp. tritici (strain CRL 75-36-700-3 / race SCCL) TaxID=418459 RepID=E3KKP2_PUCGT|nr:uncharacterized protein PGTG_10338 [Puccinia graminis f. sp. tritici CRL 75-36-700-3]EFP84867.2 hypothetical protein PGTG_10338 [Puccinia graminis f. sp. tritici CRL 75-36-700-3]
MLQSARILLSVAHLLPCIIQRSESSSLPNETTSSSQQLPGNLNASSFQIPSLSSILPSANSTKALNGLNGLASPAPIAPLSPDALAKQSEFDRKNIPARPVHAAGAGAYGTFTVTTNFAQSQTSMDLFSNVGQTTPVTVRFSNALGEKGSFDTARNVRGFAMKFQTKQGAWDLVSNNAPVFFIRDPAKFPPLIQSQSRDPLNNLGNADTAFNYFPNNPETMNMFLRIFSSAGASRGWIHTNAWSINTYRWYKSDGTWSYVRINFETKQGVLNFTASEQAQISDPSYGARELYSSIQAGQFPRWTMFAQVLSPKDAENFRYNVLDDTKEWPTSLVVPQEIGVLELNKNPANYFTEVEKLAFSPANVIPGWAASQDPVLQMRLFAYSDSSRYRLGSGNPTKMKKRFLQNAQTLNNPAQILKNSAQMLNNPTQIPNGSTTTAPKYDSGHSLWINQALKSLNQISPIDFEQPSFFYGNLTQDQKSELIQNIAGGLSVVSSLDIQTNLINWLAKASPDLSQQVSSKLKMMTG